MALLFTASDNASVQCPKMLRRDRTSWAGIGVAMHTGMGLVIEPMSVPMLRHLARKKTFLESYQH